MSRPRKQARDLITVLQRLGTKVGEPWPRGQWVYIKTGYRWRDGQWYQTDQIGDWVARRQSNEASEAEANARGIFRTETTKDQWGREWHKLSSNE